MRSRFRSRSFNTIALLALISLVPSCGKKQSSGGGDPAVISTIASTDHLLFAHLDAKSLRNSPIVKEVMDAFANQGERKSFDEIEQELTREIGVKLTSIDAVTVVLTELNDDDKRGWPAVIIVATDAPINKQTVFNGRLKKGPDTRGLYPAMDGMFAHFPDDKTMAIVHSSCVDRYLGGYARDRSGWPLNAELIKAAQGHTAYVALNASKFPADVKKDREVQRLLPLFEAKSAVLTIDVRGKEFAVEVRGTFENGTAANAAKATLETALKEAAAAIAEVYQSPRKAEEVSLVLPLIKEAHRAIAEARVSVSGNELTASTSYKANFNVGEVVKAAVEKVRAAAARAKASNNLRQIGLAMHNYHSAMNRLPIGGLGKNGEPVRNPKDAPLLSWRVHILPYIEQAPLYNEFKLDEPWDSEHNKKLISRMPKLFEPVTKAAEPGKTHLQQIVGPQCMNAGRVSFNQISDGTSNTIAVIEAAEPVIWTKPDDVHFPEREFNAPPPKDLKKKFGGLFPTGFNVLMWDGSVRFVDSRYVSDSTLWNLLRPADGNVVGSDW